MLMINSEVNVLKVDSAVCCAPDDLTIRCGNWFNAHSNIAITEAALAMAVAY